MNPGSPIDLINPRLIGEGGDDRMKILIKTYKDEIIKEIDCEGKSRRQVEKIDDGLNINLNHEEYYTIIKD